MKMDLWECSKPILLKEEFLCKNECEVIINVVEHKSPFNPNMNIPENSVNFYKNNALIKTNIDNGVIKKNRPKAAMRFGCIICDYKTANSTNFKIHLRTHTGEKPYKCEICPYRAKVLCALYRHKRVHTGERPYACSECAYRAAQPSHLVRHKMVHTGERPHSCTICDYSASQMSHLVRHMSVHTNYRPYPCNECSYRAKRKSHLQKHLGTHEKERKLNENDLGCRELRSSNQYRNLEIKDVNLSNYFKTDEDSCKFCIDFIKKPKQEIFIHEDVNVCKEVSLEFPHLGHQVTNIEANRIVVNDENVMNFGNKEDANINFKTTKCVGENLDHLVAK